MSIRKNTWNLDGIYDLTKSGQNGYLGAPALFLWGRNNAGQLGQNNRTYYSSPVQIPGTTWSSISGGNQHSLATKIDGTLWGWGYNNQAQLGQNNTTRYSSPVQIPGTTWNNVVALSNNSHTLATKTDGTLWSWGYGTSGQLGQNNTTRYSSPAQVPGTTWNKLGGGENFSLATKTDGTLWSWGSNSYGQLGQNNRTRYSSPIQIPGTTWSSISASNKQSPFDLFSLATKTDGTLWAWGSNDFGQLGQNNRIKRSSPTQVPGTNWSSVYIGYDHTLATKTDGTLWAWGSNYFGQLAQNNRTYYSSPVQIPGTTWSSASCGEDQSLATKTDGTLWAWGIGSYGNLGQSNTTQYSSPVQIPGTTWNSISAGGRNSSAFNFTTN